MKFGFLFFLILAAARLMAQGEAVKMQFKIVGVQLPQPADSLVNYGIDSLIEEKHSSVYWAELLVRHITPDNTNYRHKETLVTWADASNGNRYQSYTDCSSFINSLLKQTYNLDEKFLKAWLGKSRPLAYNYFDAIAAGNHFKKIDNIHDIQPGDLLVIKYADRSDHEDNTGHCMLVTAVPQHRIATSLIEPRTEQYEISVIDSSKKPHGKTDTRHTASGDDFAGSGKGAFRLYTDNHGTIKGYSWSIGKPKADFDPFANPVIAGRIEL